MRRSLRWITLALLPLLIIVVTAEALPGEVATNTIGRLAFLGAMAFVPGVMMLALTPVLVKMSHGRV